MSQLHLHLVRAQQRPAPLAPDAAARLSGADCAVIAGDEELIERHVTGLICLFLSPLGYPVGELIAMLVGWVAGW